jgi:hypothetical protein
MSVERVAPNRLADERETLTGQLDFHRATLLHKLRAILVHMIQETARHNGHADIIREAIDGATGQ